jgi:hypothetical protein
MLDYKTRPWLSFNENDCLKYHYLLSDWQLNTRIAVTGRRTFGDL